MEVPEHTLTALGFSDVRGALGARCHTEVGAARARARPFLPSAEAVQAQLALVEEARRLKAEPLSLPLEGVTDVGLPLERAHKGGLLEPRELIAVCRCLFAFERSSELLAARREALPGLSAVGARLPVLEKLATRLDRSFEASGEIADRASPDLRAAREAARGLHRRIRHRLDELLHDAKFSEALRETYYSVRNDRYVVPVKSSHQREVTGIVHNASQSGQTLFVEPQELVDLGNALAIAQSVVLEEERKVLLELSALVGREADRIAEGVRAAAELDELRAAAQLADDLSATVPVVEVPTGSLVIRGLRHPRLVLKGGEVVANDVEMAEARALIVSGPNAGGKTVTLTGVGLSALMLRAGLPIPGEAGSRVPLFSQVFSAVGDLQDLARGLSTFSAHITAITDIVAKARPGSLVLIDEIAADTDPREGAAIATAVLEDLLAKGALVLVTTHLEELKALAHLDRRFVNARVGFDDRRMAPTYRLQLGLAGSSSAIDIARRVGLPEAICDRAAALSRDTGGALSKALTAADEERRALMELRAEAQREAQAAAALTAQRETELAAALRQRREDELKFREALKAELEFARTQLRALSAKIESTKSDTKAVAAASAELTERINEQTRAERELRAQLERGPVETVPLQLKRGARARHSRLDAEVEIVEVSGDQATVTAGALRMRVPISELGPPRAGKEVRTSRSSDLTQNAVAASAQPLALASPRLDLRGERAEDALRQLEAFLDRLAREGEPSGVIIHGHGSGALKAAVRERLASSPYAQSHRPGDSGEGGDGVTVVLL